MQSNLPSSQISNQTSTSYFEWIWLVHGAGVIPYLVERTGRLMGMEGGCIRLGGTLTLSKYETKILPYNSV